MPTPVARSKAPQSGLFFVDTRRSRIESAVRSRWFAYAIAASACATTTAVGTLLTGSFYVINVLTLFLLTVFLIAVGFGRGPAVMSSFLSVALFDFFFLPPTLSFAVADREDLLSVAIMLVVALMTAHLTAGLSREARAARLKEDRIGAFYKMARELSRAAALPQVAAVVQRFLRVGLGGESVLLVEREGRGFVVVGEPERHLQGPNLIHINPEELDVRQLVQTVASTGKCTMFDGIGYFPLKASGRVRGVLAVSFGGVIGKLNENRELIETIASLVASSARERLTYSNLETQLAI